MTTFVRMSETRWWYAPISGTARSFARGNIDRLAAAAFARLLTQHGIEFDWTQEDGAIFRVGKDKWWPVRVKGVTTEGTLVPLEEFDADTPWVAYVNTSVTDTVVFMGLSYRTEKEVEAHQLLVFEEWALSFTGPYAFPEAA